MDEETKHVDIFLYDGRKDEDIGSVHLFNSSDESISYMKNIFVSTLNDLNPKKIIYADLTDSGFEISTKEKLDNHIIAFSANADRAFGDDINGDYAVICTKVLDGNTDIKFDCVYIFSSKEEAIAELKQLFQERIRFFEIGDNKNIQINGSISENGGFAKIEVKFLTYFKNTYTHYYYFNLIPTIPH